MNKFGGTGGGTSLGLLSGGAKRLAMRRPRLFGPDAGRAIERDVVPALARIDAAGAHDARDGASTVDGCAVVPAWGVG